MNLNGLVPFLNICSQKWGYIRCQFSARMYAPQGRDFCPSLSITSCLISRVRPKYGQCTVNICGLKQWMWQHYVCLDSLQEFWHCWYKPTLCTPMTKESSVSFSWANGSMNLCLSKNEMQFFSMSHSLGCQFYSVLRKWCHWLVAPHPSSCMTSLHTHRDMHTVVMQSFWINTAYKIQSLFLPRGAKRPQGNLGYQKKI